MVTLKTADLLETVGFQIHSSVSISFFSDSWEVLITFPDPEHAMRTVGVFVCMCACVYRV